MNKNAKIEFFFEDTSEIEFQKNRIKEWILQIIENEESIFGFINIVFCSDEYLLNINKEYLGHDYYTDIITFDLSDNEVLNTDLFISTDRVKENSKLNNNDFKIELYRVISHGILHMVGYDDKSEEEKTFMRRKEDFYLKMIIK